MFEYAVIGVQVFGEKITFSWKAAGMSFELVKGTLDFGSGSSDGSRIGDSTLCRLEDEVRLRIPEKFLKARGWL